MANIRLGLEILASGGAATVADLKKIQQGIRDTKSESINTAQANQQLGGSVTELASKYFLVVQALQATMAAGKAVYGSLIQQNVELQAQLLGTQSSLAATNKVFSGGIEITDPTEAIQALEGPVNAAVDKIRKGSLELVGVTSAQLIPIFQNIAGQSAQIGASLDDSANLTLKFAAAMGTLQIPLEQQRQEVSSILQANISQDSILAKSLGITNEQVRVWKQQGTAVEELNKRLETFSAGNKLASQSIGGIASNIQEFFDNITLDAGSDLTAELARDLSSIYKLLIDNKDEILAFVESGADAISSLIGGIKDVGGSILKDGKPGFDELGGAIANAGGLIEALLLGVGNLAKQAGEIIGSPLVTWPLALAKNALFGLQAIAALNGQFGQGTEAAEIYRQQSAQVANEAIDALAKTKRGDVDAAQARKNSIASIEGQIKVLQESNLVGTENRDVIQIQINQLEGLKTKLAGAGSNIKLVSKDTQQLTSDLKLLGEQFDAQGKSAELATAKLTAAVKRARLGNASETAISAREEQAQLFKIEQEGLNARLKLAQNKADGISAIAAKGGDAEQQKEFTKQLTAAQLERFNIEGQIAEKSLNRKKALQDLELKDLETSQGRARDAIAQFETEKQRDIQAAINAGIINEQRANLEKLGLTHARIDAELSAEQAKGEALKKLKFDDPDEREANQAKIRASAQKTAELSLKLLESQRTQEIALSKVIQKTIQDRTDDEKNQSEARQQQLTAQLKAQDLLNNSIDRQGKLLKAQSDLASAQSNLQVVGGQIEIDNLNRALELRKKLNDENLNPAVRRAIQDQLKVLTGAPNTSEAKILAERVQRENQLQQIKRQSLALEQAAAQANLDLELQRNQLASQRLVIETKNAQLAAQQALAEAQSRQEQLQADPNADPQQLKNAQAAVDRAAGNVNFANQTATDAQTNLTQADKLAGYARATLAAQQRGAIAQFEAADSAQKQANYLALVEAKATNIAKILKSVTPTDFERTVNGYNQKFQGLTGAPPLAVPLPQPIKNEIRLTQPNQDAQLQGLRDLVNLQAQAVTHLSAIASRRPVETINKTTINNEYNTRSSRGLPR